MSWGEVSVLSSHYTGSVEVTYPGTFTAEKRNDWIEATIETVGNAFDSNTLDGKQASDFVNKTGDAMTGTLKLLNGSAVNESDGGTDNNGFVNIVRIKIKDTHADCPIKITLLSKYRNEVAQLIIKFGSGSNTDPALDVFQLSGSKDYGIYIAKRTTSTWDLLVDKNGMYGYVFVDDIYIPKPANREIIEIFYPNVLIASKGDSWVSPTIMPIEKINSPLTTTNFLYGNQGKAIINSTAPAGEYTMLDKLNGTNGVFTDGVYEGKRIFQYTKKETVDSGDNAVTYSVTLLDESGNSHFPNMVDMDICKAREGVYMTYNRPNTSEYATSPATGTLILPDLTKLSDYRSFIGTCSPDGNTNWKHIISERHRGGYSDGQNYGMYLMTPIAQDEDDINLYWRVQNTDWHDERILLDSYNYKRFCLSLLGGTIKPEEIILEKNEFYTKMDYDGVKTNDIYSISMYNKNNQFISGVNLNSNDFSPVNYASINSPYLDLGNIGYNTKWRNIYAQNGVIQTSDRTQKTNVANLETELTKKFIMGLIPCSYKMTKGTSGRTHYGLIAQDVEELMIQLGIDNTDFAGFIKSPKKIIKYEEHKDKNGNKVKKQIEEVIEGEYEYGLRYEEFIAPLIKVVQEQQETINKQQKEIEELKEEIKELKQFILKAV